MPELPSGIVTFLFTDIERSTESAAALGNERWADALQTHRDLLRPAFQTNGGSEVGTEGDSFFVAFARADDAVEAAIQGQRALEGHPWPGEAQLRVRMGMHTGEALVRGGDYIGHDVHRAKRVCDAGHGGQVLLSTTTADLVRDAATIKELGPHRLKDLGEPQPIYQLVAEGLQRDFPRLRSLEALDHNIPIQLTSFVGRESELEATHALLGATRLLTITGAGGSGKTRIALQLLADVLLEMSGGVWVADLAPLTDASLVAAAVVEAVIPSGRAVETSSAEASPPIERLVDHFGHRRAVVLLDNCEHVLSACADLAERLLRSCPDLKIVVTTREPLGIAGETSWRLPSLDIPETEHATQESVLTGEATRLFCDRAAQADASFVPRDDNARAIIEICRRLDGIPLAIELAASRVRLLEPAEIARRLDDRFRLLTGGSRTAMPRQQTLRATVDWSYELLDESQRLLLDRLSVFAGGFTLAAAEAVCADSKIAADDVLDVLGALVDRSLVLRHEHTGAPRFRLLDTIRHYAREKLVNSGTGEALRRSHMVFYSELLRAFDAEIRGPKEGEWIDALDTDLDNLRAAFEWALSADPPTALRMSGSWWFLACRGHVDEVERWAQAALAATPEVPSADRSAALRSMALARLSRGDASGGTELALQSRRMSLEIDDVPGVKWAFLELVNLQMTSDAPPDVLARAREALEYARAHGLVDLETDALFAIAMGDTELSDDERSAACQQTARRYREAGDAHMESGVQRFLGGILRRAHNLDAARQAYEEAVSLAKESGCLGCIWSGQLRLARLCGEIGDLGRAKDLWRELLLGLRRQPSFEAARTLATVAVIVQDLGQLEHAAKLLGAAEALSSIRRPRQLEQRAEPKRAAALRAKLGDEAFDAAFSAGTSMSMDDAVAYSVEVLENA